MRRKKDTIRTEKETSLLRALVAGPSGEIFDLDGYAAVGMAGDAFSPLTATDTLPLPHGSELMLLPDRHPVLFNLDTRRFETVSQNPFDPAEPVFAVAAFNSPGHVITHTAAYGDNPEARVLPLFSYGAVGWLRGKFRSAALLVDPEKRQDLRFMKQEDVQAGVARMRRLLPENRLRAHLEKCALTYGCPAGKNFFLSRYEAPLPTARQCNARCLGCISLQDAPDISCSQERIGFTPSPEEIAQVALAHIGRVKKAVVSFGQGCEGDPLLAAEVIVPAIRLIREKTDRGTINLNTNGSLPEVLGLMIEAGLDSIRISMNSVRELFYSAYYRPRGYDFQDVVRSIDLSLGKGIHVAVNYLNMPGFTDTPEESGALLDFIAAHPIHLIQWRNLNFDPLRYLTMMNRISPHGKPMGMGRLLEKVKNRFPSLRYGYFNPPKESYTPAGETAVHP